MLNIPQLLVLVSIQSSTVFISSRGDCTFLRRPVFLEQRRDEERNLMKISFLDRSVIREFICLIFFSAKLSERMKLYLYFLRC